MPKRRLLVLWELVDESIFFSYEYKDNFSLAGTKLYKKLYQMGRPCLNKLGLIFWIRTDSRCSI
jgi:hypothetical protein